MLRDYAGLLLADGVLIISKGYIRSKRIFKALALCVYVLINKFCKHIIHYVVVKIIFMI